MKTTAWWMWRANFIEFTHSESCGKCIPCRVGLNKCLRILNRVTEGAGTEHHVELLDELSRYIRDCSLCGLTATTTSSRIPTTYAAGENSRRYCGLENLASTRNAVTAMAMLPR